MPGKANPVRAVLLRRAALAAPAHLATLHLASAGQVEERADGAWHAEWPALRALVRREELILGRLDPAERAATARMLREVLAPLEE